MCPKDPDYWVQFLLSVTVNKRAYPLSAADSGSQARCWRRMTSSGGCQWKKPTVLEYMHLITYDMERKIKCYCQKIRGYWQESIFGVKKKMLHSVDRWDHAMWASWILNADDRQKSINVSHYCLYLELLLGYALIKFFSENSHFSLLQL